MKPPSNDEIEKVRGEFGLNEQQVRDAVEHLKDWIQLQPHLPTEIDDGRLERWLIRCKNSTEKVKKSLDLHYTLRTNVPEVMTGWNMKGEWWNFASNNIYFFPMPQLTTDCDRVVVIYIPPSDVMDFNVLHMMRLVQMMMEIKISEDYCRSDIYVADYGNLTMRLISKITPSILKKFELCSFDGYSVPMKAFHFLNAPPFCDTLFSLFKRAFNPKFAAKIQVHGDDWTSFYEQVPKEVLPIEYGGKAGTVAEHWDHWKERIKSYQDTFLEREKYSSDEFKRTGPSINISELLGFEASFGKLDID
jgi:hypothetical protein